MQYHLCTQGTHASCRMCDASTVSSKRIHGIPISTTSIETSSVSINEINDSAVNVHDKAHNFPVKSVCLWHVPTSLEIFAFWCVCTWYRWGVFAHGVVGMCSFHWLKCDMEPNLPSGCDISTLMFSPRLFFEV